MLRQSLLTLAVSHVVSISNIHPTLLAQGRIDRVVMGSGLPGLQIFSELPKE